MTTRFSDHLLSGALGDRPAADSVPQGTLYAADDGVVYQSDASTWSVWAITAEGSVGPTGATGPSGPQGLDGLDGAQAATPTQGLYDGATASVASNGGFGEVSWSSLEVGGTELLDRSDPTLPAVLASGTYAISLYVHTGSGTPGGYFNVNFDAESPAFDFSYHALTVAVVPATEATYSVVINLRKGHTLHVGIDNGDGVDAHIYAMEAVVVKIA